MKRPLITTIIVALLGIGVYAAYQPPSSCVSVYVDYGTTSSKAPIEECIPVNGEANALELLASANIDIEGTQEYGNAVVCRVNGLPDASVESCESMPPAEAYWAIFIKEHELFPIPFNTAGEWGWAQTGINEVVLKSSDSLGLVFIENGEVRYP